MLNNGTDSAAKRPATTETTLDDAMFKAVDASVITATAERYYDQLNELFPQEGRTRAKAFGQFFTPTLVSGQMIRSVIGQLKGRNLHHVSVIDPFCGDGRLLVGLLRALASSNMTDKMVVKLTAWDIDKKILYQAKDNIEQTAKLLNIQLEREIIVADAFSEVMNHKGEFDICITNPPWSSTKSVKKSSFSRNEEYKRYQKACMDYALMLDSIYEYVNDNNHSRIVDTNMSRFGLKISMDLLRENGICGVVMPESFLSDSSSRRLREFLFTNSSIKRIDYYTASLKLFKGADQGCVSFVFVNKLAVDDIAIYSHLNVGKTIDAKLTRDSLGMLSNNNWSIPLGYGSEQIKILFKLGKLRELGSLQEIRICKEKDETRIKEILKAQGDFTFVKGYMVDCYAVNTDQQFLNASDFKTIPESVFLPKIVWRDISRATQRKRVKATLVPEKYVAGNSLGVLYTKNQDFDLHILLAIINSYVFEFLINSRLANNHVSIEAMKRTCIPDISYDDRDWIKQNVINLLSDRGNDEEINSALNARIARCYGLSMSEYILVLDKFNFDEATYKLHTQSAKREWDIR